jgi:VWFA-related protein
LGIAFHSTTSFLVLLILVLGQIPPPVSEQKQPPIRVGVELVTTDVRVRQNGRFVSDLRQEDFDVYEDGVKQKIVSFVMSLGGRIYNVSAPLPAPAPTGVILPPARPPAQDAGRIFVIFIDDAHLDGRQTPKNKDFLQQFTTQLIHEGDMFAAVSTGPSSIEVQLTYDRKRLDQAVSRFMGHGLTPNEILEGVSGAQGNREIRHRAHVAFRTAWEIMRNLEQVQHRRKAFIYISNGYHFAPFEKARARVEAERFGRGGESGADPSPFSRQGNQFSEADLALELAELTRAANRANATIYTIDPRGLVGMPDMDQKIDMVEWQDYVTASQNSLRVLAELTGGFATVNRNDLVNALKRIDQETSDYYVIGYYSSNPDPKKRTRTIDVKVHRPGVEVHHRGEYVLRTDR